MAWFDRNKNLLAGVGIGAVGVVAAPYVLPVIASALRPLLKAAITHGMLAFEIGREQVALLREHLEDAFAEATVDARARIEERRMRIAGAPAPAPVAEPATNGQSTVGANGAQVGHA
jgi:hypothetical protein